MTRPKNHTRRCQCVLCRGPEAPIHGAPPPVQRDAFNAEPARVPPARVQVRVARTERDERTIRLRELLRRGLSWGEAAEIIDKEWSHRS